MVLLESATQKIYHLRAAFIPLALADATTHFACHYRGSCLLGVFSDFASDKLDTTSANVAILCNGRLQQPVGSHGHSVTNFK